MIEKIANNAKPVLITGNSKLQYSVCACLLRAGHEVTFFTGGADSDLNTIRNQINDLTIGDDVNYSLLSVTNILDSEGKFDLAIAVTEENLSQKQKLINLLENHISTTTTICINTESLSLSALQANTINPERIIGLNWVEPAHTTLFLEIITNEISNKNAAQQVLDLAKTSWNKDPYLLVNDYSIRAKMISAMAREAFYLVENGFASVEDVDRACRNDAGYYLPFAGNFRYMDLMGTYAYGIVMKDLNPELSNDQQLPGFFNTILKDGGLGMENNKGFYNYQPRDEAEWQETSKNFSYSIMDVINKYPFNQSKGLPKIYKNDTP